MQDNSLGPSFGIALRLISQHPANKKSTLVQVMAWRRQAPSHYLNQICVAIWRQ